MNLLDRLHSHELSKHHRQFLKLTVIIGQLKHMTNSCHTDKVDVCTINITPDDPNDSRKEQTCTETVLTHADGTTGSPLASASDIHRQVPTYMADIRRDWLTNQNTDCCFVVIGLVKDNPTVLCSTAKNRSSLPNWSAIFVGT